MATIQLSSYEYDRRGDFACSRLPCCSTLNHIAGKATPTKLEILGLLRPFHGELVHLTPSEHHGCLSVPWRIRVRRAALRKYTVPAQCPRSARTVPAQCPHSARLGIKAVPAGLSFIRRKGKPLYLIKIKEPRALLYFPGGHCRGHCAGTVRALRGHCVFPKRRVTE